MQRFHRLFSGSDVIERPRHSALGVRRLVCVRARACEFLTCVSVCARGEGTFACMRTRPYVLQVPEPRYAKSAIVHTSSALITRHVSLLRYLYSLVHVVEFHQMGPQVLTDLRSFEEIHLGS